MRISTAILGLALVIMIYILIIATTNSNPNRLENTTKILESQGYNDIKFTGIKVFSCSPYDIYRIGFEAISPAGKTVEGTVCSGIFKGHTVRFD